MWRWSARSKGWRGAAPILLFFEDAHWANSTSLELLDRIVQRISDLPVLLVLTCRPEFAPPWVGQPQVTVLALNRLGGRETVALVDAVARGKQLAGRDP